MIVHRFFIIHFSILQYVIQNKSFSTMFSFYTSSDNYIIIIKWLQNKKQKLKNIIKNVNLKNHSIHVRKCNIKFLNIRVILPVVIASPDMIQICQI